MLLRTHAVIPRTYTQPHHRTPAQNTNLPVLDADSPSRCLGVEGLVETGAAIFNHDTCLLIHSKFVPLSNLLILLH